MSPPRRIVIVGNGGYVQVAESLMSAAVRAAEFDPLLVDTRMAQSRFRLINAIAWRMWDHTPPFAARFQTRVMEAVREGAVVLTTGLSPVFASTLRGCAARGALCVHYSTDDPWNPGQSARWLMQALPLYDFVFTPRTSNIGDFERIGCRSVRHLPFGYDERILAARSVGSPRPDVLFVGGADADRIDFVRAFLAAGGQLSLIGGYWDSEPETRSRWLGHVSPDAVATFTLSAKVNLVLVRRANRDGHVMRSLEAGALGGCLLVEDTPEHRSLFGEDGETVRYFGDPLQAAALSRALLKDEGERRRLTVAVRDKIRNGGHSYDDRLRQMISIATGRVDAADGTSCSTS